MKYKVFRFAVYESEGNQVGKRADQQSITADVYAIGNDFEIGRIIGQQNRCRNIADDL